MSLATNGDITIRVGISTCLLGQNVRYDGGHKRDAFLTDIFGQYVEWVSVCPELEAGLGVPRESMHLQRVDADVRLLTTRSGIDHTDTLRRYSQRRVQQLQKEDLCGYVLKKGSPSCGMERVKIYGRSGPLAMGRGLFGEALLAAFPHLPVEEEGRLNDPRLRENFVERVFAYRRLKSFFAGRWSVGQLVAFHSAHKLQLMAHSPKLYAEIGRMVAGSKTIDRLELRQQYQEKFMSALEIIATPKRHQNVLLHMFGYFSRQLDDASRREVLTLIEDHGRGQVPLLAPLILIRHYVRKFDLGYLIGQTYLEPHPKELMLRNHV